MKSGPGQSRRRLRRRRVRGGRDPPRRRVRLGTPRVWASKYLGLKRDGKEHERFKHHLNEVWVRPRRGPAGATTAITGGAGTNDGAETPFENTGSKGEYLKGNAQPSLRSKKAVEAYLERAHKAAGRTNKQAAKEKKETERPLGRGAVAERCREGRDETVDKAERARRQRRAQGGGQRRGASPRRAAARTVPRGRAGGSPIQGRGGPPAPLPTRAAREKGEPRKDPPPAKPEKTERGAEKSRRDKGGSPPAKSASAPAPKGEKGGGEKSKGALEKSDARGFSASDPPGGAPSPSAAVPLELTAEDASAYSLRGGPAATKTHVASVARKGGQACHQCGVKTLNTPCRARGRPTTPPRTGSARKPPPPPPSKKGSAVSGRTATRAASDTLPEVENGPSSLVATRASVSRASVCRARRGAPARGGGRPRRRGVRRADPSTLEARTRGLGGATDRRARRDGPAAVAAERAGGFSRLEAGEVAEMLPSGARVFQVMRPRLAGEHRRTATGSAADVPVGDYPVEAARALQLLPHSARGAEHRPARGALGGRRGALRRRRERRTRCVARGAKAERRRRRWRARARRRRRRGTRPPKDGGSRLRVVRAAAARGERGEVPNCVETAPRARARRRGAERPSGGGARGRRDEPRAAARRSRRRRALRSRRRGRNRSRWRKARRTCRADVGTRSPTREARRGARRGGGRRRRWGGCASGRRRRDSRAAPTRRGGRCFPERVADEGAERKRGRASLAVEKRPNAATERRDGGPRAPSARQAWLRRRQATLSEHGLQTGFYAGGGGGGRGAAGRLGGSDRLGRRSGAHAADAVASLEEVLSSESRPRRGTRGSPLWALVERRDPTVLGAAATASRAARFQTH